MILGVHIDASYILDMGGKIISGGHLNSQTIMERTSKMEYYSPHPPKLSMLWPPHLNNIWQSCFENVVLR